MKNFESKFRNALREMGLSVTKQRLSIARTVFDMGGHYSIDQILTKVRVQTPKVGYTTVYRTMKVLVQCGLIVEHKFGSGVTRFEVAGDDHHDHMVCLSCGDIIEFHNEQIEETQILIAEGFGFQITKHRHILYGYCNKSSCEADRT